MSVSINPLLYRSFLENPISIYKIGRRPLNIVRRTESSDGKIFTTVGDLDNKFISCRAYRKKLLRISGRLVFCIRLSPILLSRYIYYKEIFIKNIFGNIRCFLFVIVESLLFCITHGHLF